MGRKTKRNVTRCDEKHNGTGDKWTKIMEHEKIGECETKPFVLNFVPQRTLDESTSPAKYVHN